ncbi:hypothetical protein JCM8115_004376 [Rhodotorula mucilaginosa]
MAPANWYYDSDTDDFVCDDCDLSFYRKSQLMRHLGDAHWYCSSCDQTFGSMEARRRHWANASAHRGQFCNLCDCLIPAYEDMATDESERHWPCQGCDLIFATEGGHNRHGQQDHPWCHTHKRAFRSQANYEAHMRSSAHVGRRQPCPFGCGHNFADRSSVAQHLEAGTCSSGVTRAMVDQFLRTHDRNRFITTGPPRQLIGGPEPVTRYIATERSYSHSRGAYVCVLCQSAFTPLRGLNAHLASPRHTYAGASGASGDKAYKCPNSACGRKLATLSGVVQHAESGSCGVLQVRGMTRALDTVLGDMRRLTL